MKADVFISYVRADEASAKAIAEFLRGAGIGCWIDQREIRFAEAYDQRIAKALRRCTAVLWIASKSSVASDYVRHEISSAVALGKPIGPVYLEPLVKSDLPAPFDLDAMRVHGIQYFREPVKEKLAGLRDDLRGLIRRRRWRIIRTGVAAIAIIAVLGFVLIRYDLIGRNPYPAPVLVPERIITLPAGAVLKVAYEEEPMTRPSEFVAPRLKLAVLVKRSGETSFRSIADGEPLVSESDDYVVAMRPLSPGYAYIFQVDARGQLDWLFPANDTSSHSWGVNPVEVGAVVQLPPAEKRSALYLDQTLGIEHVYAVFSATRWERLEESLTQAASSTGAPQESAEKEVLIATNVSEPNGMKTRGVAGTRPSPEAVDLGEVLRLKRVEGGEIVDVDFAAPSFEANGALLVVERWFRHVDER